MGSTGLIDPDRNPRDGIFNPSSSPDDFTSIGAPKYPDGDKLQALAAAHCTPEYLEFLRHPALRSFVRELMGWDKEVLLARTLLRHCVPNGISSAIHYDKIFLRGGDPTNNFLTAWVPIGDIAQNGGGLIYLEGSTDLGKQIEADFTEKAKEFTKEERMNAYNKNMAANGSLGDDAEEFYQREGKGLRGSKKWLATNYEAGDVIFHNPYIVHGTSMNEDQFNRIRLSTDLRFYEEGTSLDERWFRVWTPDDGL
jgi:phytanoyl-CoA hydroxylase